MRTPRVMRKSMREPTGSSIVEENEELSDATILKNYKKLSFDERDAQLDKLCRHVRNLQKK